MLPYIAAPSILWEWTNTGPWDFPPEIAGFFYWTGSLDASKNQRTVTTSCSEILTVWHGWVKDTVVIPSGKHPKTMENHHFQWKNPL
jgi:hypothetical protein